MGTLKWPAKGDFCVVCVRALLFLSKNRSFKIYLCTVLSDTWMGKYSNFPSQNTLSETKICNLQPKAKRRAPRHFYMGVSHRGHMKV